MTLHEPHAVVLALAADMIFASRIKGAAQATSTPITLARTPTHLIELAQTLEPRLILLDLDTRALPIAATIQQLRGASDATIVAFVSHVNEDAITTARDAGAHRVLARSAFVRLLPDLLTQ